MFKLDNRHRLFVEAYTGDTVEAMQIAGYVGAPAFLRKTGDELLQQPIIREAIQQRSKYIQSTLKTIATREERQAFWTSIQRNEDPHYKPEVNDKGVTQPKGNLPLAMRLKASELLGKSETDFIERLDVHHNLSISDVIQEAYTIPMDNIDAIEAQYNVLKEHKEQSEKPKITVEDYI